jgi:hypothetical protein
MNIIQKLEQSARAPGLCLTRILTIFSIFVRQLGDSSPWIVLDVTTKCQQFSVKMMQRVFPFLFAILVSSTRVAFF